MLNNTNGLLTIIAIALIGILAVMVIEQNHKKVSPGEKLINNVGESIEEIGDEIDDNTSK